MRAYHLSPGAGIAGLSLREQAVPEPAPNEALVRVRACALNRRELLVARDNYPLPLKPDLIPVSDGAGEVVAVGADVTRVRPGDRVTASIFPRWLDGPFGVDVSVQLGGSLDGMLAEYVAIGEQALVPVPAHLSFEQAAALPCAAVTAWHALTGGRGVLPGETVLTLGSGGVSLFALQFAGLQGARTIATTSDDSKSDRLRALGAEHVVNYRTQDFVEEAKKWTGKRGVDVVIEHIGGETFERSSYTLTRLGTLVSIGSHDTHWGRLDLRHVYSKNLRIVGTNLGSIVELRTLLDYVASGRVKPVIDRAFALKDARSAVQHVLDRRNRGKVLLVP
jgi:NADPH:quinone reductase-like Zn-dependent oxidoreductase